MKQLINLDECVINALELFIDKGVPKLNLGYYKRPLVLGSGNAAVTGKLLMEDKDAVFANESNFKQKLKAVKKIDGAILISASGTKHAPIIAKELKKRKIETRLLTCNPDAPAKKFIKPNNVFVFPKNPEPYTYNTSTYMGMILGKTKENPKKILNHITKKIKPKIPRDLKKYNAYYMMIPNDLGNFNEMLSIKFDELFGPAINGRVFTPEQTKHAKTIVHSDKELFVGLGHVNKIWGSKRLNLPLPKPKYGALMAAGYYFIGYIQKQNQPYFKKNIEQYTKKISKIFGHKINVIVD